MTHFRDAVKDLVCGLRIDCSQIPRAFSKYERGDGNCREKYCPQLPQLWGINETIFFIWFMCCHVGIYIFPLFWRRLTRYIYERHFSLKRKTLIEFISSFFYITRKFRRTQFCWKLLDFSFFTKFARSPEKKIDINFMKSFLIA